MLAPEVRSRHRDEVAPTTVAARLFRSSRVAWVLLVSCGPRPPTEGDEAGEVAGTTATDTGGTSGTASPTEATTADTGTGGGPSLPEACALVRVPGQAHLPLGASAIGGPRMLVLEPGQPGVPARVMTLLREWSGSAHENIRARTFVLESWPDGVVETATPLPLTRAGHSTSRLVELAGAPRRFAYVWTGDPAGTNHYETFFSILDVDAWSVGGEVRIAANTNPNFVDLLPTASPERLLATFTTDSYDTSPPGEISGFSLGVLAGAGAPVVDAAPLTLRTPSPGSELRTFWAGDRVAAAMGHNACHPDDALCVPHAVVLARPTAPDEHGAAVDGFALAHVVGGLDGTTYVSGPQLSPRFGLTWLTWYEGSDWTAPDEHRTFRGTVLDASGEPIPWPPAAPAPKPIEFMADTDMDSWPTLLVSELGITVAYRTTASTFEVRQHDFAFEPLGEPIALEIESWDARYASLVMLTEPRSLLLTWLEVVDDVGSLRMARLECAAE